MRSRSNNNRYILPSNSSSFILPKQSPGQSPSTPSSSRSISFKLSPSLSPYTPLSFRSFSSAENSNFTTPASAFSVSVGGKRLSSRAGSLDSPLHELPFKGKLDLKPEGDVVGKDRDKERSVADTTNNWRSRANENGIRVSSASASAKEGEGFADDEGAFSTSALPQLRPVLCCALVLMPTHFCVRQRANVHTLLCGVNLNHNHMVGICCIHALFCS